MSDYPDLSPLLADDPEDCACQIQSLLSVAELAVNHHMDYQGDPGEQAANLYGAELAIQLAREAVSWLGEMELRQRQKPTDPPANVAQLGDTG